MEEKPPSPPSRPNRRKLLVASIGVATVSYAMFTTACGKATSGNLPSPPPTASITPVTGNLPAPPPPSEAGATTPPPLPSASGSGRPPTSGNLPAPPPKK